MSNEQVYEKFATVYDQMGADLHSKKMIDYSRKIFRKFSIEPRFGLDLCCGTGTAIRRFCDLGISMAGLDGSAPMLAIAAKKLKGYRVPLYHKQLPNFRILENDDSTKTRKFDLITSFYDSLNYLKNQTELKTAMRSVYRHLTPGGWFIFDMNTPNALKVLWGGQTFSGVQDEVAWVWRNESIEKTKTGIVRATFFVKKGKVWERFEETHTERGYDNAIIRRMVTDVGFKLRGFYRCHTFERPTKGTYRICVVAQRPK